MIGGIEALQKAHAPLLCYLGAEWTTPQKKDHLAALATVCKANAVDEKQRDMPQYSRAALSSCPAL